MNIFINNKFVKASRATVPAMDRGFLYGDGVYETVRVYAYQEICREGNLTFLPKFSDHVFRGMEHLNRMENSAHGIGIRLPWSKREFLRMIYRTVHVNKQRLRNGATVRITVTRGPAKSLGFDPFLASKPTIVMVAQKPRVLSEDKVQRGVQVAVTKIRRNPRMSLDPANKSINNLNNIMAKVEANRRGAFEALMCNVEGYLAEGTISNVFFMKKGIVYTPALSCGILSGVTRGTIIEISRNIGLKVKEGSFRPHQLLQADEAFLTSTTLEVQPITTVFLTEGKSQKIGSGKAGVWSLMLRRLFKEAVVRDVLERKYQQG